MCVVFVCTRVRMSMHAEVMPRGLRTACSLYALFHQNLRAELSPDPLAILIDKRLAADLVLLSPLLF